MDPTTNAAFVQMGIDLAMLAVKGTGTAINSKIKATRNEKNIDAVRATYDEIINELISEREEAIRIAQTYKSTLEKIEISDKDIQHLHATIGRVLEILTEMSPNSKIEALEPLKNLINIDTLKAMQLLGFNYKEAIGEPLTHVCADAIRNKLTVKSNTINHSKKR